MNFLGPASDGWEVEGLGVGEGMVGVAGGAIFGAVGEGRGERGRGERGILGEVCGASLAPTDCALPLNGSRKDPAAAGGSALRGDAALVGAAARGEGECSLCALPATVWPMIDGSGTSGSEGRGPFFTPADGSLYEAGAARVGPAD